MKTKRILLLMIMFVFLMIVGVNEVFAMDINDSSINNSMLTMSDEFKQILNEEGKLVITDTTMAEDKTMFIWEYLQRYATDTYVFNVWEFNEENSTCNISLSTGGESYWVDVVFEEQYSDDFKAILKDGKFQIPASNKNGVSERLSSYLYTISNEKYSYQIACNNTMEGSFPYIDENGTKATIKIVDKTNNWRVAEQHVVELSYLTEQSEEFKKELNKEGKLVFDSANPTSEDDFAVLFELLFMADNWDSGYGIGYLSDDYTSVDFTINSGKVNEETHTVEIFYNYDPVVKEKLKGFINNFPKDKSYFYVKDLELVNYWINNVANDYAENLDLYSGELKEAINNNNIEYYVDNRAGGNEPFVIERVGMAMFKFNDIVYYTDSTLGTKAEQIIYVPTETGSSNDELIAAAQKKINEYLGKDSKATVTVSYGGKAIDIWAKEMYEYTRYEWSEWDPNMSLEEWKMGYMPAYEDFGKDVLFIEGLNEDTPTFVLNIKVGNKEGKFNVFIKKDSSKMVTPSYKTVDMKTNIEISSADSSIPLDTSIQAEKITSGTEYERIINILDVENNVTYDLKLYSSSLKDYVTELEDGKFEVKLPIPSELEGKTLIVYYVDTNGNVTEHEVTVKDGYAIFTTDHFSIYTLAEKTTTSEDNKPDDNEQEDNKGDNKEDNKDTNKDEDTNIGTNNNNTGNTNNNAESSKNPQTGDNILFFIGMLLVALIGVIVTTKLRKYCKTK